MERRSHVTPRDPGGPTCRVSRRALLRGLAATGLGAAAGVGLVRTGPSAGAAAREGAQTSEWQQFDAAVRAAMQTFGMVGTAVAVVSADGVLYSQTFGVRDLASGAPVTPRTLFRVGSTTKSMTALLVATFVDDGTLGWDQPVIDVWPDFRAPTEQLARRLRVRDLLGMDSGLGESSATFLHYGYPEAIELLRSLTFLPVLGPPNSVYFYNNTTYAAGGYLPVLSLGIPPEELEAGFARLMQERVFGPAGMRGARLADDPRPFTDDYATGYAADFVEGTAAEPWAPLGCFAPAGGTLAGLTDMAAYVCLQLRRGVAPDGTRVVSARNLEECWQPHIDDIWFPTVEPDVTAAGYAMGWVTHTYTGGHRLVWHNGEIDGFTTYIGILPADDLGLVVLTNKWINHGARSFYTYVLNLLLESRLGLNRGANEAVVAEYHDEARALAGIAAQARPVDTGAIAPFLGFYERGYHVWLDAAGVLRLQPDARTTRLLAMPDGSYVRASGLLAGRPVRFLRNPTGVPVMELEGLETVRWLSGPT